MEERRDTGSVIVSRRGLLVGIGATVVAAQLPANTARADLYGDAAILLAQFAEAVKIAQATISTFTQVVNVVKQTTSSAKATWQALKAAKSGHLDDILIAANSTVGFASGVVHNLQGQLRTAKFWDSYWRRVVNAPKDAIPYDVPTFKRTNAEMRAELRSQVMALNQRYIDGATAAEKTRDRLNSLISSAEHEDSVVGAITTLSQVQGVMAGEHLKFQQAALQMQMVTLNDLATKQQEQDFREKRTEEFFKPREENVTRGAMELP